MRKLILAASVATALGVMPSAHAAVYNFSAKLLGSNEVPAVVTSGTGLTTVIIDDVAMTMQVITSFSGLTGTTTASHIHCCAPFGTSAPVATTTPSFVGFPLGVTSGSMNQTYDMTNASSYRAGFITSNGGTPGTAFTALLAGMQSGQAYLNVHTSFAPGGEIRGQLALVPEPAIWAQMIAGFGILAGAMRRRAKLALRYA